MDEEKIKKKLKKWLSPLRFAHSVRVQKTAIKLAKIHKANVEDASIAGLLHDCGKYVSKEKILTEAKKLKIPINSEEKAHPGTIHANLSFVLSRKKFGVQKKSILLAIKKHTVGSKKMSLLEKIIYLADHTEPERKYKGIEAIRELSFKNMDKAIFKCTSSMIRDLLLQKLPIACETVKTRNYYLKTNE
ncbi:hypothetical protein A2230_04400 [candidate division WOR-1 bacterium RIFOXYA2_FULL_36_21]|uniref:bis(5'-nucleosyl)-tetraphosphatase (symmetrical) n=1 Tax=candidate division WOR-1 bacterium RIFOXYB2_FULL_36_35 TaxID=1802578 RepID=A0A1F4S2G5_UNCSA|nr:MAG: hypothetical protein A2230_04400 [candidate division WOR-1 bacterium RIFOXYA2_FULL_36_21]OGC14634.1 MAG: hypothetical protein A2290_01130 [candidate division WOR-1 bacterium RIFOXYB2_FULL_36_35]OGC19652.1 MAG: hypothetical protein A2282_02855 [candidate division WOR-1 bacterium RIFOXYA12_FULL_36_13]